MIRDLHERGKSTHRAAAVPAAHVPVQEPVPCPSLNVPGGQRSRVPFTQLDPGGHDEKPGHPGRPPLSCRYAPLPQESSTLRLIEAPADCRVLEQDVQLRRMTRARPPTRSGSFGLVRCLDLVIMLLEPCKLETLVRFAPIALPTQRSSPTPWEGGRCPRLPFRSETCTIEYPLAF